MNLFVFLKKIIKNISIVILILSLVFYSPVSRSAVPAVIPAAKIIAQVLLTGVGSAYLYKFVKKYGFDAFDVDEDKIVLVSSGDYCNGWDSNNVICVSNRTQADAVMKSKKEAGKFGSDAELRACYLTENKHNINCPYKEKYDSVMDDGRFRREFVFYCVECNAQTKELVDVIKELLDDYYDGDEDAKRVIDEARKKESGDDDSDSSGTEKKDDDDSDSSSGTGTDKKDDDDSDSSSGTGTDKKDDDDGTDGSGASDDLTCDSTKFHKKVCDWIEWTYDTYDTAHDKIKEYFEEEDIEKANLKDLVKEEEVIMKKSDFDLADACPAPQYVHTSFLGNPISIQVFNFEGVCKWASFIEYALQTTSLIIAFNIIAGRREV